MATFIWVNIGSGNGHQCWLFFFFSKVQWHLYPGISVITVITLIWLCIIKLSVQSAHIWLCIISHKRHTTQLTLNSFETEWRIYALVNKAISVQIMSCRLIGTRPLSKTNNELSLTVPLRTRFSDRIIKVDRFNQKNAFENVACEISVILVRPRYVYTRSLVLAFVCSNRPSF